MPDTSLSKPTPPHTVAIVGAGIAGAQCGHQLAAAGLRVTLFDKGRVPGGRMGTRRVLRVEGVPSVTDSSPLPFDIGAQFFTARDARFRAALRVAIDRGEAAVWRGRFAFADRNGAAITAEVTESADDRRYVGVPGMDRLVARLLDPLDVHLGARVTRLSPVAPAAGATGASGWHLTLDERAPREARAAVASPFDHVIVATPTPLAVRLLRGCHDRLRGLASRGVYAPCWTLMFALPAGAELVGLPWDAVRFAPSPAASSPPQPFSWIARNSSMPGRAGPPVHPETWVAHASPAASKSMLELAGGSVRDRLLAAFRDLLPILAPSMTTPMPEPIYAAAHRWRYSLVTASARLAHGTGPSQQTYYDASARLGVAGDGYAGGRVEAAFLGGQTVADALLATIR